MKHTTSTIAMSVAGLLCAGLLVAPQAATAVAPTPGPGAVAGGRTSGDTLFPNQGNSGYDVRHYDVAIAYAANGSITATTTIDATVTAAEALSEFALDLEGLTVSAVTVNGAAATFSRVTDAATTTYKLIVTPATPITGDFTVAVTYSGTPTAHTDPDGSMEGWTRTQSGGVVALNEPVGAMTWFPNNNTPTDKATFTTKLTVPYFPLPGFPTNQTAVSTGSLASVTSTTSTRTFTWEQPNQQATYLALAAIGTYTTAESDVALTTGTTREWSYANTAIEVPSSFGTRRAQLSPMLKAIERNYGTYPGASIGMVVDQSTLGYALETQDRPYFETSIGQNTLIHELVHQWFGNAVSPTDWSDIWLNEGPATFVATQVTAELYGGDSTEDVYYDEWNTTAANSTFWQTPVAGFSDPADLFGSPTYERGAMTLEAMRSALGEEVFLEIMSTWIETYSGGDASTAEWIALSEEISGRDLTAFFQDWLYDTDKPAWPSRWDLALTDDADHHPQRGRSAHRRPARDQHRQGGADRQHRHDRRDLAAGPDRPRRPAGRRDPLRLDPDLDGARQRARRRQDRLDPGPGRRRPDLRADRARGVCRDPRRRLHALHHHPGRRRHRRALPHPDPDHLGRDPHRPNASARPSARGPRVQPSPTPGAATAPPSPAPTPRRTT